MNMNQPLPADILIKIQSFVDAIEAVLLQRQITRSQRTNICDEVESQIHTMIARRIETGSELNLDLVSSIIESMDQPDSYAQSESVEPATNVQQETLNQATVNQEASIGTGSATWQVDSLVPKFIKSYFEKSPHLDPVGILGVSLELFGVFFLLMGPMMRRHEGEVILLGFSMVFLGAIASAVSFWRIRQSKGKLRGIRFASLGLLLLPCLLANGLLFGIIFGARLWMAIGFAACIAGIVYGNYRCIKAGMHWLESSSIGESIEPVSPPTDPIVNSTTETSVLNGATI